MGKGTPSDYTVFIDLEDDTLDPIAVGLLTTFGIAKSSDPDAAHGGGGMTQVYDISDAAEALRLTTESAPELRVSFERIVQQPVTEAIVPQDLEVTLSAPTDDPSVEVGRIGIYSD